MDLPRKPHCVSPLSGLVLSAHLHSDSPEVPPVYMQNEVTTKIRGRGRWVGRLQNPLAGTGSGQPPSPVQSSIFICTYYDIFVLKGDFVHGPGSDGGPVQFSSIKPSIQPNFMNLFGFKTLFNCYRPFHSNNFHTLFHPNFFSVNLLVQCFDVRIKDIQCRI